MEGNPDVVLFGMMSSMRTGNMLFDMCMCLLLPMFFRNFWNYLTTAIEAFREWLSRRINFSYRRTIEYQKSSDPWRDPKVKHKNLILQNAIRTYIGRVLKPPYPTGQYKLTSIESTKPANSGGASIVEQLEKKFTAIVLPGEGEWVEIEPGLWYNEMKKVERQKDEEDRKTVSTTQRTVIELSASRFGGKAKVDAFIRRAYDWYVAEVAKDEDDSRFMYQPLSREKYATAEERAKPRIYKRYQLSDDKNFDSLFFPEKQRLLKLIQQFQSKGGKYSIPGFAHKLGLLLYGPPGTGKTSLVKAMAAVTKRHIISVPLGRVHTNQELMDIMFDQVFKCKTPGKGDKKGEDDSEEDSGGVSGKHAIKDVIFLLEDVDAASDVVLSRESKEEKHANKPPAKAGAENGAADLMTALLLSQLQLGNDTAVGGDGKDGEKKEGGTDTKKLGFSSDKDRLTLAGLLNILDGVVDAPGRILIMTTNHRERLDPALMRPGRVNLQIKMDYIRPESAAEMMAHYYPDAEPSALQRAVDEFERRRDAEDFRMSPAEMEQLCAENDSVVQLMEAIRTVALPPRKDKEAKDANSTRR